MPQTMTAPLEPRACTRADVAVEVTLELDSGPFVGSTENISEGGLFIAFPEPREIGLLLSVSLKLPGVEQPIRVASVVRWVRRDASDPASPPGMGLMFLDLDDDSAILIRQLVEDRVPLFWE